MRKITIASVLMFLMVVLLPAPIVAQNKTIKSAIKLPTFVGGSNKTIDTPIEGDLMMAGGQLKITSKINGDVYVAGGQIDIEGDIAGNLIVAGGNITIKSKIGKNLITAGGQINVENPATVGGYTLVGGGDVKLDGQFAGPVKVGAGNFTVSDKTIISGNLEADISKSEISTMSAIKGEKNIKIHEVKEPKQEVKRYEQFGIGREIFSFISKLIVLLVFVKIFFQMIKSSKDQVKSFWSSIGWGLIVLIVTPVVSFLLMVMLVTIPLSFMTSGLYILTLYLSGIVSSLVLGKMIVKDRSYYLQGMVGLLVITLLGAIPIIGGLVKLVSVLFGTGVIFKEIRQRA